MRRSTVLPHQALLVAILSLCTLDLVAKQSLATAVTSDDISGYAISLDGSRDEDNSIPPLYPIFSYKLLVTAFSPCSGSLLEEQKS